MAGLFRKKEEKPKPQRIVEYSPIEQGMVPPVEKEKTPVEKMLERVLANQITIVENQQMIIDAIAGTQNLMRSLAGEEPGTEEVEEEEEPPKPTKKPAVKKK